MCTSLLQRSFQRASRFCRVATRVRPAAARHLLLGWGESYTRRAESSDSAVRVASCSSRLGHRLARTQSPRQRATAPQNVSFHSLHCGALLLVLLLSAGLYAMPWVNVLSSTSRPLDAPLHPPVPPPFLPPTARSYDRLPHADRSTDGIHDPFIDLPLVLVPSPSPSPLQR